MGFLSSIIKSVAPIAIGAIPGIGPVAGSLLGAAASGASSAWDARETQKGADKAYNNQFQSQYQLNEQTNAQRIAAADAQMDFQERMSNTAHQREMTDLKKAGLNPLLSAKYGGSSTPGGAMPSLVNSADSAASSAAAKRQQFLQERQLQSSIDNIEAQTNLTNAKTVTEGGQPAMQQSTRELQGTQAAGTRSTITLNEHQMRKLRTDTELVSAKITSEMLAQTGITLSNNSKAYQIVKQKMENAIMKMSMAGHMNQEQFEIELGSAMRAAQLAAPVASTAAKIFNGLRNFFK